MSLSQPSLNQGAARGVVGDTGLLWLFTGTILISAFLLFGVQPMFTKLVLPQLGGSPAVWSVAMVFFQALLLGGYLYAHLSTRFLPPHIAVIVHAALLVLSFLTLPLSVSTAFGQAPDEGQALWLIGVFALSVGLPFLTLSATAPLMQAWFARSGHPSAQNPYQLYIASNIGSFAALLLYPLVIEPLMSLRGQTHGWMALFSLLGGSLVAAGTLGLFRMAASFDPTTTATPTARKELAAQISLLDRLIWIGLASVPSGLLVACTAHLSTDVASAPLLWVVPLALFMLTFVFAFQEKMPISDKAVVRGFCWSAPLAALSMAGLYVPVWAQFAIHLSTLFFAALMCHRQMYHRRPAPERLTEFYLWMSFGGMVGGIFAGLAAPFLFNSLVEYRILLIAAALCVPAAAMAPVGRQFAYAAACVALALAFILGQGFIDTLIPSPGIGRLIAALLFVVLLLNRVGPIVNAGALLAGFMILAQITNANNIASLRSFFGVNYVRASNDGNFRLLTHGSTVHGAVHIAGTENGKRPEPTVYYHQDGGINAALGAVRRHKGATLGNVAVLGLGAGAMACHAQAGEQWSYFEIDRVVIDLALREEYFPFVRRCTPDARIIAGDARLTIQRETRKYDVIILDTFSSDAVPAHLLTKEAFAIFAAQLAPGGVVIAHVSNRYMDLMSVAKAAGLANGLVVAAADTGVNEADPLAARRMAAPTSVVAMSPDPKAMEAVRAIGPHWHQATKASERYLWTDDYANIVSALGRRLLPKLFPKEQ